MEKPIGYIIFVSYNFDQYKLAGIEIDNMTLIDFVRLYDKDKVNCLTLDIKAIYKTTALHNCGSEMHDDSRCWYVSANMVDNDGELKSFIDRNQ